MSKELKKEQPKGRQLGSKNINRLSNIVHHVKGMLMSGFTISNNKLRITIASQCGGSASFLYITILAHRNRKNDNCFPTIEVLSKETGFSERKISDLISVLCESGYLIVRSGGRHYANNYWFPYEYFFNPKNPEVLMAYRRKAVTKKAKLPFDKDNIKKEIIEKKKEFAYSEKVFDAIKEMDKSLDEAEEEEKKTKTTKTEVDRLFEDDEW